MLELSRSLSFNLSALAGRSGTFLSELPPKRRWELTQESFDRLLAWLNPNRDEAGIEYEKIHSQLIKGFRDHSCAQSEAEYLADETINRVAKKLPEIEATYIGPPARYFFGVAHKVHLESLRKATTIPLPPREFPAMDLSPEELMEDVSSEFNCLEQCMKQLTPRNRDLILQYYQGEKHIKIESRKTLAMRLGVELPLLRLQAQRIRTKLKECILHCLAQGDA